MQQQQQQQGSKGHVKWQARASARSLAEFHDQRVRLNIRVLYGGGGGGGDFNTSKGSTELNGLHWLPSWRAGERADYNK